jgi:hypothetical protein
MAHAWELETSVYLHLDSERVPMEKAKPAMDRPSSEFIWMDLMEGSRVLLMDESARLSKSRVYGDPTLASPDKGKRVFEAVGEAFLRLVREFKNRPRGERTDWHKTPWQSQIQPRCTVPGIFATAQPLRRRAEADFSRGFQPTVGEPTNPRRVSDA